MSDFIENYDIEKATDFMRENAGAVIVVDGEADPGDTFSVTDEVTSGDVYTTEGYTHYDEIHDITALIARDMFDAPSHTAILYVTTYLEGYDRIVTIPIEFRFSSSSG